MVLDTFRANVLGDSGFQSLRHIVKTLWRSLVLLRSKYSFHNNNLYLIIHRMAIYESILFFFF